MNEINERQSFLRNKKVRKIISYLIRFSQLLVLSMVPSAISVLLIFFKSSKKMWMILILLTFIVFMVGNWLSIMDCKIKLRQFKKSKLSEFYIVNIIFQLMYVSLNIALFFNSGSILYSALFTPTRAIEILRLIADHFARLSPDLSVGGFWGLCKKINTIYSVIGVNILMIAELIVCERYSEHHIKKVMEFMKKLGADEIEMEDASEDTVVMQNNQEVKFISIEETLENEDNDIEEAKKIQRQNEDDMPEGIVSEKFIKGNGEKVTFIDYTTENPDEQDPEAVSARESLKKYEGDSLWESNFYQGEDENKVPEKVKDFDVTEGDMNASSVLAGYEEDSLWESNFYQGKNQNQKPKEFVFDDDETPNVQSVIEYTVNGLWDNVSNNIGTEQVTDEDEDNNPNREYGADSLWQNVKQGKN